MTAILERLIAFIAPHTCIACGIEDNSLCEACLQDLFVEAAPACVFCGVPTPEWRVCQTCKTVGGLKAVWVASEYDGLIVDIMRRYKFARAKALYKPLAQALDATLPYLPPDTVVVPLPTASRRIRQRGYDQTVLLAKELARIRGLTLVTCLRRTHSARQLGATRKERQVQAKDAYQLSAADLKDKNVLLVDDICTTGASLAAAAKLISRAGAAEVSAVVVAWQRLDKKR